MKNIIKIVKDNYILIVGSGLLSYNLFNFSNDKYCNIESGRGFPLISMNESPCINPAVFYYYDEIILALIATGVVLTIIGLLKIKEKKSTRIF